MRFPRNPTYRLPRNFERSSSNQPESFVCGCSVEHLFPSIVYKHWDEVLNLRGDFCGREQ